MSRKVLERDTRQRFMIDAARRLFAERGIEDTSMENIAGAAEYTRRTLYSYFKSRDEICMIVFLEDLADRWAAQKRSMASVRGGLAKIRAWGKAFYLYARENPHSMRLQFYWDFREIDRDRLSADVLARFESLNDELADGLREVFRLGIEDGSLRPGLKIDLCISQFIYTFRTVLNRALSSRYSFAELDPEEYVNHYLDLFSRGIRNLEGKRT